MGELSHGSRNLDADGLPAFVLSDFQEKSSVAADFKEAALSA
jgi:hypothetical protein